MLRDPLHIATAAEVRAGRRWYRWSRWWARRAKELKTAAAISAALTAIAGSYKAVRLMFARNVGAAEQQIGGSERTAMDRVDKPRP
jgi:hypothetical protein